MKKFLIILLSVIALVVLVGGGFVGKKLYDKYSEGTDRADLSKYFSLTSAEIGRAHV